MGIVKKEMPDESPQQINLKTMKCELNFLSKSDGSAILSQGETVALVSVNGPLDVKMQSQNIEKSTLEVLYSTKGGVPSVKDRYKENIIRQTCEVAVMGSLYPRTGITVNIQEMEDYGGLLACIVNCVCLALLNSGIAMNYVFAAVTCAVNDAGNIILEPGQADIENSVARMTFVFDSRSKGLVTDVADGTFSEDTYKEAMERCRVASDLVFQFYRDIVSKYSVLI